MYTLVLDTEFKTSIKEFWDADKNAFVTSTDYSPFNPDSYLVSVHWAVKGKFSKKDVPQWHADHALFRHDELDMEPKDSCERVQEMLDGAALIVGHNIKIDMLWLWANGFRYDGMLYDTMNGDYIAGRGQLTHGMSLKEAAKWHGVTLKDDRVQEYFDKGHTINQVPLDLVKEYGDGDCISTGELYDSQVNWFAEPDNKGLLPTLGLTNEFCMTLARMEFHGMKVDEGALDKLESDLREEYVKLESSLNTTVKEVMGDTPININSSEQLAWVIYSRKPVNKREWAGKFVRRVGNKAIPINRNLTPARFKQVLRNDCKVMYRTDITQCPVCKGAGKIRKIKKDGTPYTNAHTCKTCKGKGYLYLDNGTVAGFKFNPPTASWISASGFSTSKNTLATLEKHAHDKGNVEAENFLKGVQRLHALGTYLNSFVKGIRKGVDSKHILRCNFNQTRTATGRLSASSPNFQNFPRGKTFPIKRAFVSRFTGGHIVDIDFAQLEFRAAGELSGCPVVAEDLRNAVDVHSVTASVLSKIDRNAVNKDQRQAAKPETFKPLYGGLKGTPDQERYYKAFLEKYFGVAEWHYRLQEEAIATHKIVTLTGREFDFGRVIRYGPGKSSHATKIKNYPVQSFATADMVPWACILIDRALRRNKLRSVLVNTVHDSIVIDVAPGEERMVLHTSVGAALAVRQQVENYYNLELQMEYPVEATVGKNWMEQSNIYYQDEETLDYVWKEGWE